MGLELESPYLLFFVPYNSAKTCSKCYSLACIARAMVHAIFCRTTSCDSEKMSCLQFNVDIVLLGVLVLVSVIAVLLALLVVNSFSSSTITILSL